MFTLKAASSRKAEDVTFSQTLAEAMRCAFVNLCACVDNASRRTDRRLREFLVDEVRFSCAVRLYDRVPCLTQVERNNDTRLFHSNTTHLEPMVYIDN